MTKELPKGSGLKICLAQQVAFNPCATAVAPPSALYPPFLCRLKGALPLHPDISFLTLDPDLGAMPFTVIRSAGTFDHGELIQSAETYQTSGIIQPGGFSDTDQQTGEDKQGSSITVYTRFALTAGEQTEDTVTLADEILYDSKCWRVMEIKDNMSRGFCIAKAAQVKN